MQEALVSDLFNFSEKNGELMLGNVKTISATDKLLMFNGYIIVEPVDMVEGDQ